MKLSRFRNWLKKLTTKTDVDYCVRFNRAEENWEVVTNTRYVWDFVRKGRGMNKKNKKEPEVVHIPEIEEGHNLFRWGYDFGTFGDDCLEFEHYWRSDSVELAAKEYEDGEEKTCKFSFRTDRLDELICILQEIKKVVEEGDKASDCDDYGCLL